jgi:predicted phosphodiesterase
VLLCHGTPRSDHEYFLETVEPEGARLASLEEVDERMAGAEAALIACGHSHVQRAVRASSGCLIVNPGSVGLQAYDDDHLTITSCKTARPMRATPSLSGAGRAGRLR